MGDGRAGDVSEGAARAGVGSARRVTRVGVSGRGPKSIDVCGEQDDNGILLAGYVNTHFF